MTDATLRSTPLVPPRMATPPPPAHAAKHPAAPSLTRAFARHAVTLVAVAIVVVVIALLDRAIAPPGADALPLSIVAVAGLGAAAVGTTLRRLGVRNQIPSPRRRAAPTPRPATAAPESPAAPAVARARERRADGAWPRLLLRTFATLGVAALLLALVIQSPHSAPLLIGVGVSAVLGLRLVAAPARGPAHVPAVTSTPRPASAASVLHAADERVDRASRDAARRGRPADEVHEAALDSFPASDPPSWSPLRIGAPAAPERRITLSA